ncbi:hypothetical protein CJF31_00007443 [Rutstroemia sp. NJR-2017a BVV2]|nr:hypothetical protein CJF31_00007443 [Rutstroemia sp. NJR-2017a BVV2]
MPIALSSPVKALNSSSIDSLSRLPNEIKSRIISFLPASDVTNLRLTCRAWGGVCVAGLFNKRVGRFVEQGVFSIRPHCDDMTRLRDITSLPWLAKVIKHIKIYIGDLDMLEFDHEVQMVNRYTKLESRFKSESGVNQLLERIVQNRARHCDPVVLLHSLFKLPAVDTVTATSTECPFAESEINFTLAWEGLQRRWDLEPDTFYDSYDTTFPTRSGIRHICILLAARQLRQPLRRLVLDSFPLDLFVRDDLNYVVEDAPDSPSGIHTNFLRDMQELTSTVQTLRLGLNRVEESSLLRVYSSSLSTSMNIFLGSMQNLRSLDLSFNMSSRFPNESHLVACQDSLYSNTFPYLERLRLSKVRSIDSSFYDFILRHKSTLKYLSLGHDFFLVPQLKTKSCVSFKSILTRLRESLKLERFQLLVSAKDEKIYDEDWELVPRGGVVPDAKLFEMFVLGKWSWPMVNFDSPHWRRLDEWKGWVRRDGWNRLTSKKDVARLQWRDLKV